MAITHSSEQAADALIAQERARTAGSLIRKAAERGVHFPYRSQEVARLPPREQRALLQKARDAVGADTFVQCLRWGSMAVLFLLWLTLLFWGPKANLFWLMAPGFQLVDGMYALIVRGVLQGMVAPPAQADSADKKYQI
nr:hypothetical protein [uncultured Albidiferax sp.]